MAKQRATKKRATKKRTVRRSKKRRSNTAARRAAAPVIAAIKKNPDAKVIAVVGDFLASGLGRGLDGQFAENPAVAIVNYGMPSSGLVRDDHFDWPEKAKEILTSERGVDVAVILIGANDRQPIRTSSGRVAVGSEAWIASYRERINELAKVFMDAGKPVVWVGLPPMKSASLSDSLATFGDLQEQEVTKLNASFVDIWDGFADENGRYVANGPDPAGQIRRLRTSDGINFASAGREKAAFFAINEIKRALGGAAPVNPLIASAPEIDTMPAAKAKRPDVWTQALGVDPVPVGALLGASKKEPVAPSDDPAADIAYRRLQLGLAPPVRAGRVDEVVGLPIANDTPAL